MDEEETNEESEATTEADEIRDKSETLTKIEQANEAAERMEAANKKREELISREEDIIANKVLGGGSEAGTIAAPKFSDEEKASRARIKAVADASGSAWGEKYA